jgi:hypothetical protein
VKTSFLICPVRGVDPQVSQGHVAQLEADGYRVHWPHRDTDQDDLAGLRICRDNMMAIAAADVVHVIWDGKSQGCLFDLGIAFALGKSIIPLSLPPESEGKSFQNMIRAWAGGKTSCKFPYEGCKCFERMGNDFWFLPADRCLYEESKNDNSNPTSRDIRGGASQAR